MARLCGEKAEQALRLWRVGRMDTAKIAEVLSEPEAAIYNTVIGRITPRIEVVPVPPKRPLEVSKPYDPVTFGDRSYDEIAAFVCARYRTNLTELKGQLRDRYIAEARMAFYLLCRRHASPTRLRSTVSIGKWLGGRDHATVISGSRKAERVGVK